MPIPRRTMLGFLAGVWSWPLLPGTLFAGGEPAGYVSARVAEDGAFRVSGFRVDGRRVFDLPLPDRGHAFALHPKRHTAVHFARRPGRFAVVIDLTRGLVTRKITTPDNRHFYGHGVFSPDGRLLYATENDFEGERGVIGVYDAADGYRRTGELPSHGIGPHEIRLLADGRTLVVANGGVLTHPELPRVKLNLPTMSPSLAYVDRLGGQLLEQVRLAPALHQLSIRHVAAGRNDTVAVAMQYQGPAGHLVPLVGTHRRGEAMSLVDAPQDLLRTMNQYCGSVAFDRSGRLFAASSPRGNIITTWNAATGALLSTVNVPDGCGVAPGAAPGEFLASSGRGGVFLIAARSGGKRTIESGFVAGGHWDNHMMAVAT